MTLLYNFVSSLFHKRKGTIILEHGKISNIIKDVSNADLHFRLEGMIIGFPQCFGIWFFAEAGTAALKPCLNRVAVLADTCCGYIHTYMCYIWQGI